MIERDSIGTDAHSFKKGKAAAFAASALTAVAAVATIGISVFVGLRMTKKPRKPIDDHPDKHGMVYEDIHFLSRDGRTALKGWVLEPLDGKAKMTIIFSHGYAGNRLEPNVGFMSLSQRFIRRGFRVVLFDFRRSGESGGKTITIGTKEKLDLLGAIDWVKRHDPGTPIGLYGISMGASTSILSAAEEPAVIAVVADSPFSDLKSYLRENLPVWTNLPHFPFTRVMMSTIPVLTGVKPHETSPISVLDKLIPRKVLFIHGKGDAAIPCSESRKMAESFPEHFELWLTDCGGHVKSYETDPETYAEKVIAFFDQQLQGIQAVKSELRPSLTT
ncbi:alpha/beta hydrolase [Marinicrinis lubricantis]|uniref:Alpha/beta hydrolase n=1 Tax=Marinicrinis lubricantis TaxID=2086470 RepID=A0ABW1IJI6_9BACL